MQFDEKNKGPCCTGTSADRKVNKETEFGFGF